MNLLPKIHKRLSEVPGRPEILNCVTPMKKASLHFWIVSLSRLWKKVGRI